MTDFLNRLQAKRALSGEADWIVCPCQEDEEEAKGWLVGAMHNLDGSFIHVLLCPECENEISVVSGVLD